MPLFPPVTNAVLPSNRFMTTMLPIDPTAHLPRIPWAPNECTNTRKTANEDWDHRRVQVGCGNRRCHQEAEQRPDRGRARRAGRDPSESRTHQRRKVGQYGAADHSTGEEPWLSRCI